MGDNVVAAQAREIMARFECEVHGLLENVKTDNERLEARVRDLEAELSSKSEALARSEKDAEEYRRWGQKLYVQLNPPTEADIEFWRNAKPSDFPYSWEDLREILDEAQSEK